jgi:hypothetical protein
VNTDEKIALVFVAIGFGMLVLAHQYLTGKLAPLLTALGG